MSAFLTSVALLLATASAPQSSDAVCSAAMPTAAEHHLRRGVLRNRPFEGWRRPLMEEAMQEAWCLVLENHPDVVAMTDAEVGASRIQVERRSGSVVELPLETRLYELGVRARNTVLRDNHLNRQSGYRPVRFTSVDEDAGYQLAHLGSRRPAARTDG